MNVQDKWRRFVLLSLWAKNAPAALYLQAVEGRTQVSSGEFHMEAATPPDLPLLAENLMNKTNLPCYSCFFLGKAASFHFYDYWLHKYTHIISFLSL